MATQKEVAELAGVSFITVSRVVNNEGNVKEETRRRVEEAIRTLGYEPSFAGKALNSGKSSTIGVMTPARFGDGMENTYLMSVLRGIQDTCRDKGYDILLSPLSENDPGFDYLRPYRQKKADGMIYVGLRSLTPELSDEIRDRKIPCVVIGDRPAESFLSWIDTDNETAAYETTRRIWELGHRRIAFHGLSKEHRNENIADRERGYRRAIKELSGKDADEKLVLRASYDIEEIRASANRAFRTEQDRPTAIFCSTDIRALAVLRELETLGLSVPRDVSVAGFDGFIQNHIVHPAVATNAQPLVEMGRRAAEILIDEIITGTIIRREEIFPVPFIPGESLARPR